MKAAFFAQGKQVLMHGAPEVTAHYADAADPKAAEFIAEACSVKAGGGERAAIVAFIRLTADMAGPDKVTAARTLRIIADHVQNGRHLPHAPTPSTEGQGA